MKRKEMTRLSSEDLRALRLETLAAFPAGEPNASRLRLILKRIENELDVRNPLRHELR
jgi:hypothetical protein